jgi:hypothetical protein
VGVGRGRELAATEVDVHLGVEHAFEGGLHHVAEEAVEVVERGNLGGHLAGELFGLGLQHRVHA